MRLIGYFPGANFSSESQFGRQIHVHKFIESVVERDDVSSLFFVEDDGGKFPNDSVRNTTSSGSFPRRFLKELIRLLILLKIIYLADEPVVIYTRESPHFAPVIAAALSSAALVVESNGVPRNVRENVNSLLSYYSLTTVRWLKWRRADHIIAVSESVADYLRSTHNVDRLTVVENGVDVDAFSCNRPVQGEPPYKICYVGGLQKWQNIELMLETIALVEPPVEFLIVGGEEDRQTTLRAHAKSLNMEQGVRFVGRVPHGMVPDYINQADLCFGPFKRYRPASPLKIYEYLSCGREVFLVNDTGLEQFDSYPGIHRSDFGDAKALAPVLETVLENVQTNEQGAKKVRENRSWDAVADNVLNECKSIVVSR